MNFSVVLFLVILNYNLFNCDISNIYTLQSPVIKNEMCQNQSAFYYQQLSNGSKFAEKMIDSSSKIPNGILEGSYIDIGQFDECLDVVAEISDLGELNGKHCMVQINIQQSETDDTVETNVRKVSRGVNNVLKLPLETRWSICVPAVCPASDVEAHLQYTFQMLLKDIKGININVSVNEPNCQDKITVNPKLEAVDWFSISYFSLVALAMIASTCYDFYLNDDEGDNIGLAFSVRRNYKNIIKINRDPDHFHCFNGIRCISIIWIILGHRFGIVTHVGVLNTAYVPEWEKHFLNEIILGFHIAVDSFFVMSGMLLVFSVMKLKAQKKYFNIPMFFLHRYLRLTPPLLTLLLFYISILKFISNGPLWPAMSTIEVTNCKHNWWQNLLYVQNFLGGKNYCMLHTWYLATDMQLFWLSPFVIIPLYKWPKIGTAILVFLIIIVSAVAFVFSYVNDYKAAVFLNTDFNSYLFNYYTPVYTRAATFLLGIYLGYVLYISRNRRIILNKVLVASMWALATLLLFFIPFGQYFYYQGGDDISTVSNSMFIVLHRIGWAFAICWIIFACLQGYGGVVNSFLSASIFQVVAKLSYCMYLVHFVIILIRTASTRAVPYLTTIEILYGFCGDLLFSILVALIWTLAFEIPFGKLESKILTKRNRFHDQQPPVIEVIPDLGNSLETVEDSSN